MRREKYGNKGPSSKPSLPVQKGKRCRILVLVEGLLVVHIFAQTRSHTSQLSDVIANLLDGLHLFLQILGLKEVAELKTQK